MQSAKLFTNGHSQAVRLSKAFRFEGVNEVTIERDGEALILRPIKPPSIERLIDALDKFEDFPERDQPEVVDRREGW